MSILLLIVGLLATAAGLVTIGFGIPNNAFSFGNTLIVSGTIGVAAGLILIGLAAAIGQLRRITEALNAQPLPRLGRVPESVEAMVPPTARMTPPPTPSHIPARMPPPRLPEMRESPAEWRPPEPGFAGAPNGPPAPLDWLRAKSRPGMPAPPAMATPGPAEPPMVEVPEEVPLSPRTLQRPPPAIEPAFEPKGWSPGRAGGSAEPQPAPRPEQPMPRATPQAEPPRDKQGFDSVWPEQPAAPAPGGEAARPEPTAEMPSPFRPRDGRPAERRAETTPKPTAERGPAILKSGVIDGMPYTLYADGSIEAELPHGTVKFASVDALRAHLEKQGG